VLRVVVVATVVLSLLAPLDLAAQADQWFGQISV
jgi:hypothetical protein